MSSGLAIALVVVIVLVVIAVAGVLFLKRLYSQPPQPPRVIGPNYTHDFERMQYHGERIERDAPPTDEQKRNTSQDPRWSPLPRCPSCGTAISFDDPICHKCGRAFKPSELKR